MPGGALHLIQAGALDDVHQVFGLHCDPSLDVGRLGLREGPLTGAADSLVRPARRQGRAHLATAPHRGPHLRARQAGHRAARRSSSRRLDPRAGVSLVWGMVRAGAAANVIPGRGTPPARCGCSTRSRGRTPSSIVRDAGRARSSRRTASSAEVTYLRGVPPVVNDAAATAVLGRRRRAGARRRRATSPRSQSLGGEDFAWYLDRVPGAMARLGTRTPGGPTYDLHQGDLRVDERCDRHRRPRARRGRGGRRAAHRRLTARRSPPDNNLSGLAVIAPLGALG